MKFSAIATGLLFSLSLPAFASDNTDMLYVGGQVGAGYYLLGDAEDSLDASAQAALAGGATAADSDTDPLTLQFGLQVGYQINRYFAMEVSYRNLGKADARFNAQFPAGVQDEQAELTASGLGIGLLGFIPLSRSFNLMARVDAIDVRTHSNVLSVSTITPSYSNGGSTQRAVELGVGLGFQINYEDCSSLRVEATGIKANLPTYGRQTEWPILGLSVGYLFSL